MKTSPPIESQIFFDSLTKNAIEFLKKSVEELEKSPKYSVIHFCSAIELFIKARLLIEHWSLIVSKPEQAHLSRFKSGNFNSVSMGEAIRRLKDISADNIGDMATEIFSAVRNHRNKLVHFFHEQYLSLPDKSTLDEVVPEQYSAWYYLHSLIYVKWKPFFRNYLVEIENLNRLMHRHKEFLSAKFIELQEEIINEQKAGVEYVSCVYCGFESSKVDGSNAPLLSCRCRICHLHHNYLSVACPDCDSDIIIKELGAGICDNCGYETDLNYLFSILGPVQHHDQESSIAYCGYCDYSLEPTAIPFNSDYLCLNCLELHDPPENCDWCNELVVGMELDNSYLSGCVACDGHGEWK